VLGQPRWFLRPGEPGYTPAVAGAPSIQKTSFPNIPQQPYGGLIQKYAQQNDVPPALLSALVHAESRFDPRAVSTAGAQGLAQLIPSTAREMGVTDPFDPEQNIMGGARYLREMYDRTGSWSKALSAYNRGPGGAAATNYSLEGYRGYTSGNNLISLAAALDAAPGARPPQRYIPSSYTQRGGAPSYIPDRPSSMWGRDPVMRDMPGSIPMQHEFPAVMAGLAPIILALFAGVSGFAGTAMLTAFGAYGQARNRRQLLEEQLHQKQWRDNLAETKAKLQTEQIDAAGAMAMEPGSPEQMEELHRIALRYDDRHLLAAVESGDPKAAERLFQMRDRAYQDISKVGFADLKMQQLELQIQLEQLRVAELAAKTPAEVAKIKAQAAAAKAKLDALRKQEEQFPGSTGGVAPPDETAPDTETPAETPDETPTEPTPPATAAPPRRAPSAPEDPGWPSSLPPRFGPQGPPAGYTGPGAPRPTPSPARPEMRAEAQPTEAPPEYGLYQLTEDEQPTAPPQPARQARAEQLPPVSAPAPIGPSQAAIEDSENNTVKLGRTLLHGGEPPPGMQPGVNQAAETVRNFLASKLTGLATSGLTGKPLVDAVRKIDNRAADILDKVMSNRDQLPNAQGFGSRMQDYRQMLAQLAFAAAPPNPETGDPGWQPDQYGLIQKFKDENARTQFTLQRANTMSEAAGFVMQDLKRLQDKNIGPEAIKEGLAKFTATTRGDPEFSSLASDLQRFTQEEQFLIAGHASVTETERGIQSVYTPIFPGSPEQIREYMQHGLQTAAARVHGFEHDWKMLHAPPGPMYGSQPYANAIMDAMPYLNPKTGAYSLPAGMTLPDALEKGVPTQAAPSTGWGPAGGPR